MLTVSSASLTPSIRASLLFRNQQNSNSDELYRPRTILIEKSPINQSYGFSIQTYGFASLNQLGNDESAFSFISLSTDSTASRKSSASALLSSQMPAAPIQLLTYVDRVHEKSSAWQAGLRAGSIILSVNDQTVENDDHETLIKRITDSIATPLKLVVIQQNINKQIALCEKLQQLQKLLNEKEEELKELCRKEESLPNERNDDFIDSPAPCLEHDRTTLSESFCHDRIPLDWRQSVTNFVHQQNLNRTVPIVQHSKSSISATKFSKFRPNERAERSRRSVSMSNIVFERSRFYSNHRRRSSFDHQSLKSVSHQDLSEQNSIGETNDQSFITSGCSLAMDFSRSFALENSSSSSSSSSIETDEENETNHQFKWKLRINHRSN